MIDVRNVEKSYGRGARAVRALHDVSFSVRPGEVIGLLGPNGAGKTTMIKILTGYLQPDAGSVIVDGLDVLTDTLEVQRRVGYLPENVPLYREMRVSEYLFHRACPDGLRSRVPGGPGDGLWGSGPVRRGRVGR